MKLSFRKAILLYTLIPVIFIFVIFALENIHSTRQDVHERIGSHMSSLAYSYANLFNEVLNPISGIANTTADILQVDNTLKEEDLYRLLMLHVEHNPIIYGAWIAYAPYQFDKQQKLFAPYVFRQGEAYKQMDLGYDYTNGAYEFWNKPVASGKGEWTEPYFAKAGNIMMSSYVVPFYINGRLIGVAGIDIPLHDVSERIQIPGMKEHNVTVLSKQGKIILFPNAEYIGESIFEVIEKGFELESNNTTEQEEDLLRNSKLSIESLIKSMMSGESGMIDLTELSDGNDYWYFYAPIKTPGWSFAIRLKESEVFSSVYERFWYSLLFFGLLLFFIMAAIFFVSGKFSSSIAWLIDRCLRIERMNFQQAQDNKFNIKEVTQLSGTLDRMCAALNSHFSVKEDVRIAKSIRQQTLPTKMRHPSGFEFCVWSQSNAESCGETYDSVDFRQSSYSSDKELFGKKADGTNYLLLDAPDNGIDAAVKNTHLRVIFNSHAKLGVDLLDTAQFMNDYLVSELALPGPVQAWFGTVDNNDSTLSCISLGLNAVFYYSAESQNLRVLPNHPFALSMQKKMSDLVLQKIEILPNDFVVVASDGVWGAINENREQFGIESLEKIIMDNRNEDVQTILDAISQSIGQYTSHTSTKMNATVMLIKRNR